MKRAFDIKIFQTLLWERFDTLRVRTLVNRKLKLPSTDLIMVKQICCPKCDLEWLLSKYSKYYYDIKTCEEYDTNVVKIFSKITFFERL